MTDEKTTEKVVYQNLDDYERSIFDDVFLNIPIRMVALTRGYHGEAGRQQFYKRFSHLINAAHIEHHRQLRGAQWELAVTDKNPTMLIFLGKQAGQSDLVASPLGEEAADNHLNPAEVHIVYPKRPEEK